MSRTRLNRRALCRQALCLGLGVVAAPSRWAQARNSNNMDRLDIAQGSVVPLHFETSDGAVRFAPERVLLQTADNFYVSELPGDATVVDYARVNLSEVPIIGGGLGRPMLSYIEPGRRVGALLRSDDDLVIALDPPFAGFAPEFVSGALALATYTRQFRLKVALRLPPLRAAGRAEAPESNRRVGDVYDAGDTLLLAAAGIG